ncbi:CDP-glycerol glycerophosphotransferase family protein [Roseburia sp. 499]|uniref:CDP-glycerol glycerophosphotransferase family protein n=1 Tax=Roseburia sp. 499 TaxID=1261634 RepID=UPI0009FA3D1D|nr:CDP-glycerol glycerophosphotransferase family protein [Roseburia sp. 499]WVK69311.1 CDP-glycerol glycerophosphotransferase family protein [Roseburia sp. 499]
MDIGKKLFNKFLKSYIDEQYEEKILLQAQENIEVKRQIKLLRQEKIRVVFVCHRAQVWDALKSVCEACIADEQFDVTIVTIPNKKQLPKLGLNHEEYASEGAEEFFSGYPCQVVQGYDYEKREWLDLRNLQPDYLFFQTPYDVCRPPQYKSDVVSLYTKLCYVHYGMPFMDGYIAEESFPRNFLKHTYFHFAEFQEMQKFYVDRVAENSVHKHERVVLTGYPKLDGVEKYIGCESKSWHFQGADRRFRIMWTPRWSTGENNCTFFEFKDKLLDYIENKKEIEFLFRPHPQAFAEFVEKKEMTEAEVESYKQRYESMENAFMDPQREYLPSFYSSDVLITDESSIIPEYFLTGKPVIFTYKETHLNEFARRIAKGFYWVKDWQEMEEVLVKLEKGQDDLKEKREQLIQEAFYMPKEGSGFEIKECLKKDFNKEG